MAGIILCGFAGLAFAAMSSSPGHLLWITRLIGPAIVFWSAGNILDASAVLGKVTPQGN